jgi:hypothetical protein
LSEYGLFETVEPKEKHESGFKGVATHALHTAIDIAPLLLLGEDDKPKKKQINVDLDDTKVFAFQ